MQKFIEQFKLSPAMTFKFDNMIYSHARTMLGRTAGMWDTETVGDNVTFLRVGDHDHVANRYHNGIQFYNPLSGDRTVTDIKTASAAFTLFVINWFWNANYEHLSEETNEAFERVYYGLRDAATCNKFGINGRDFLNITD